MKKFDLFIPWIIACIATVGSLFLSEFRLLEPCKLCWYQRVIMFPMVIILGIAAFKRTYKIVQYILPLTLLGLGIATYHMVTSIYFPELIDCKTCKVGQVPLNGILPEYYPVLSFFSFLFLNASLIWCLARHKKSRKL